MRTVDDRDLLEAYIRDGSEAAFGELVRRHLGWVYSVALRQVGNPALAEEVAQSAFVLLARKAGSLRSETVLGGWLFRTTRFVANRALRAEKRRLLREETAASMISTTSSFDEEAIWKSLESHLDQVVARLSETDRQAILLRFYEKKSLLEVGRRLGLSEEAAKKRVSRAIQKMRNFLFGRGVAVGATVLAGIMAEQAVHAIPSGLAASILKRTGAGFSSSAALPQLARETLNAWRWTKFKILGGLAASLCGITWLFILAPQSPISSGKPGAGQPAGEQNPIAAVDSAATSAKQTENIPGRVLHLRVLAKDSGEPVSGAPLAVNTVTDGEWNQRFDLSTDEKGSAEIPYSPETTRLDVGVVASGWTARFATWWTDLDGKIPAEYTLRVERQTDFMGGWLRDEKGQPVANAIVEMEFGGSDMAQEENPRERPGFVRAAPVARSDHKGWWSAGVVGPNAGRIPGIRARHPEFAPTQIISTTSANRDGSQNPSMTHLWSGGLITTMKRGVTLAGRIIDEKGRFVGGARIDHKPGSSEPICVEADAWGWFTIVGLPSGNFDFIVTAPGFAQTYTNVNVTEGMEPVRVRLKPGGILRLLLVDENGMPVENANVALTGPGGMYIPGIHWSAQSGPDGKVEWTSAQTNSRLSIYASRRPEFGMSHIGVKADGKEHVIRLRRRLVVTGQVMDARTGELVQGEIKAFPGYGNGMSSWYRGETRRSTDGTFRVYFDGGDWPWRFRIEAEGYSPFIAEVSEMALSRTSSSVTNIFLEPADPSRTVRGTIIRTDGQPAAGAEVALLTPEHGAFLGRGRFTRRAAVDRLIVDTDESGRFDFPEEPHASMVVAVSSNGFARVPVRDVEDLKTPMRIHLQPWGRIEGSIDASARNRPVDWVMVDDLLAMDAPGSLMLDRPEFNSKPAEDGRFSFDFLPAGQLCVWLSVGAHVEPASKLPRFHHLVWVQVASGETSKVKIAETGHRLKGRLLLNGAESNTLKEPRYAALMPAESAELKSQQWIQSFIDPGRLIIQPDGRFESRDPINPGRYRLRGRIGGVHLDQQVEVPDPELNSFLLSGGFELNALEPEIVELGDIRTVPPDTARAKQR